MNDYKYYNKWIKWYLETACKVSTGYWFKKHDWKEMHINWIISLGQSQNACKSNTEMKHDKLIHTRAIFTDI